jgi:hypothetical protein
VLMPVYSATKQPDHSPDQKSHGDDVSGTSLPASQGSR